MQLNCFDNSSRWNVVSGVSLKIISNSKLVTDKPRQNKLKCWFLVTLWYSYSKWEAWTSPSTIPGWWLSLGIHFPREIQRTFVSLKGCVLLLGNVDLGRRWKRCEELEMSWVWSRGRRLAGIHVCWVLFWLSAKHLT
jgi:hypothetical protein